jgi:hypothetical protein
MISDEFVNAGYDIQSFDSIDSFVINRFIEVKTYSNEMAFYWSKNEVSTARELGERYWLYLVHHGSITSQSYLPRVFQDPYKRIYLDDEWIKEEGSLSCRLR